MVVSLSHQTLTTTGSSACTPCPAGSFSDSTGSSFFLFLIFCNAPGLHVINTGIIKYPGQYLLHLTFCHTSSEHQQERYTLCIYGFVDSTNDEHQVKKLWKSPSRPRLFSAQIRKVGKEQAHAMNCKNSEV